MHELGVRRATVSKAPLVGLLAGLAILALGALPERGDVELEDSLQILETQHALLAVDANGHDLRLPLEIGERVVHIESRGRIGIALSDRRILAVAVGSAAWQKERLRIGEQLRELPILGDRVALILTDRRILGFDGGSGNLVERSLGPHEKLLQRAVSNSVAVVTTDRRALGLSPFRGGFFQMSLRPGEGSATLRVSGNVATLHTSRRLLTFDALSGRWRERSLAIER